MNNLFQYRQYLTLAFVIQFITIFTGAFFKINHYPYANQLLIIGFVLVIVLFLITGYDMIVSPIRKKGLWLFGLLISPFLVGFLYLFLRSDMLEKK